MKQYRSGGAKLPVVALAALLFFAHCSGETSRKLIVVGMDGFSPDMVDQLVSEGSLPVIERLEQEGISGEISSTLPPLAPTAWTTAVTGVNPGQHGIFCYSKGFTMEDEYLISHYNSSLDRSVPAVWSLLSDAGLRSVVINVPFTSPPDSIGGSFVAGGPHPDPDNFTIPAELGDLFPNDYTLSTENQNWQESSGAGYLDYVYDVYRARKEAALELLRSEDWDVFFVVFTIPERIQRFYWHHRDESHPLHTPDAAANFGESVEEIYREMDRLLDEFDREAAARGANLLVFSSYGMRSVHRELLGENFIHANWPPEDRDIFVTSSDRYFGLFGITFSKPPEVTRENWEKYSALAAELHQALKDLTDPATGEPVIDTVYHRANIYSGPQQVRAPDVIAVEKEEYLFVNWERTDEGDVVTDAGSRSPSAHHSSRGMVLARGPDIGTGGRFEEARLADITPTVLYLTGTAIPGYMDGTVIEDLVRKDLLARKPAESLVKEMPPSTREKVRTLTEEEEQNLRDQLQRLGVR